MVAESSKSCLAKKMNLDWIFKYTSIGTFVFRQQHTMHFHCSLSVVGVLPLLVLFPRGKSVRAGIISRNAPVQSPWRFPCSHNRQTCINKQLRSLVTWIFFIQACVTCVLHTHTYTRACPYACTRARRLAGLVLAACRAIFASRRIAKQPGSRGGGGNLVYIPGPSFIDARVITGPEYKSTYSLLCLK